jgi:UDP-glucose 4-epimerase
MKVLVTGGLGYIGSHVVVALSRAGHESVIVDNLSHSNFNVLNRLSELASNWSYHMLDVRDRSRLRHLLEKEQVDAVIHLAGYKAVGESVEAPLKYYDNNVGGAMVLLEVMAELGVKKLVFSSSATVYGSAPIPYKEDMETGRGITSAYGQTKHLIEIMLKDLAKSDPEWQITSLRYFNPIGNDPSGLLGDDQQERPDNLMPYLLQVAAGKRKELQVFGGDYPTSDGSCVRDYVHVTDVAEGHVKALEQLTASSMMRMYNLGCGKGISVLQLVTLFEEATEATVPHRIVGRRSGDIAEFYADVTQAKQELGWEAKKTIRQACKDAWTWQSRNPAGYDSKK